MEKRPIDEIKAVPGIEIEGEEVLGLYNPRTMLDPAKSSGAIQIDTHRTTR